MLMAGVVPPQEAQMLMAGVVPPSEAQMLMAGVVFPPRAAIVHPIARCMHHNPSQPPGFAHTWLCLFINTAPAPKHSKHAQDISICSPSSPALSTIANAPRDCFQRHIRLMCVSVAASP